MKLSILKLSGIICLMMLHLLVNGQGCVAIRSGCGGAAGASNIQKGQWLIGSNLRYFKSFRHFRGNHEEVERVANGTEVINHSFLNDWTLSYGVSDRLTLNVTIPWVWHSRSSMYEHGGNPRIDDPLTPEDETWNGDRHTTHSRGLGDIRIFGNYWVVNPSKQPKGNLAIGLGVKLPSGNYRYQDTFYNPERTAMVDQSIQPGDGGLGITVDLQGYASIHNQINLSYNLYYLINPENQYAIQNFRGPSTLSICDQYALRIGLNWMSPIHGLTFYGGTRLEGVPSSDFIGKDEGFRRPGYVVSAEPGVAYGINNWTFNLSLPIALARNRTLSYSDKRSGRHGDAAFADYLINLGIAFKLGKQSVNLDDIKPQSITY